MKLDAVQSELVSLAEGSIEDITEPQFIRLLNRAIDNRYEEVVNICDGNYMLETTLTASSESYEVDLPDDFYRREDRNIWHLFDDDSFTSMRPGKEVYFWVKGSKLRFDSKMQTGDKVYLQYSKKPTRYTKITDDFLEEDCLEMLLSELQSLYYAAIDENEPNASYTNTLNQSNRLGL